MLLTLDSWGTRRGSSRLRCGCVALRCVVCGGVPTYSYELVLCFWCLMCTHGFWQCPTDSSVESFQI
jgi:hypothetical protein